MKGGYIREIMKKMQLKFGFNKKDKKQEKECCFLKNIEYSSIKNMDKLFRNVGNIFEVK